MSDTQNLALWEKVSRVPKEHLKPFNNGKFSGTAIKPLWFTKTMTEHFGPCGTGWFIDKPEYQIVDAGESKLVYCTLAVWVKEGHRVYGVGGDFAVRNGKGDDEAFKKAYTDALTNALVKFGVGADIHMGLWDGNKYVDQPHEEQPANDRKKYDHTPLVREAYGAIDKVLNHIGQTGTLEDLKSFWTDKENADTRKKLPAEYREKLEEKKDEIKSALMEKAA